MATHSSILGWKIPGQRSLAGYSLWGRKELDTTEHARMCPAVAETSVGKTLFPLVSYYDGFVK